MEAPLRRFANLAMRPAMAAVAWSGLGMRWHHARLRGPVPWAQAELSSVPRRCCRRGLFAPLGIGVTLAVLRFVVAHVFILIGLVTYFSLLAGGPRLFRPPGTGTSNLLVLRLAVMRPTWIDAQWLMSRLWGLLTATARGPLGPGVDAPLRRSTVLAMQPGMAAVAWFGFGMR